MNMFDEARALSGTLRLRGGTQAGLAKALGVSQSYVANKLRLLQFSAATEERIVESRITERHARALLRLGEDADRRLALARITEGGLSVAETEELVEAMLAAKEQRKSADPATRVKNLTDSLASSLSLLRAEGIPAESKIEFENGRARILITVG